MQKYSRDIIMEVLNANDIVDVIGYAVELKAAGGNRLKGLCPFHHEKTPSLHVDRGRQTYHCFGCGKGGDALRFVVEQEGLSFMEALRKLADRGGVRLPAMSAQSGSAEDLRAKLLELNKFVSVHCRGILEHPANGTAGRSYLEKRKLNGPVVQRFLLGLVPDGWSNLLDAVRAKGFREPVLEASGLFKRGERGGFYDFFRNRLIFPILDVSGNVVAFGGRDLSGESPAKYINSPETTIYKKSRVLYGLHEARDAMRREHRVLLVEGYMDLLRCFSAGVENVVASCGTALTPEQASLIRRYVPEVVLVYDGDAAGIKAALKGIGILCAAGLSVRAMALPDNQDPDDFIRDQGGEAFRQLVEQAQDFVTFYVARSAERMRTIEGRTEVAQELFEILMTLQEDTLRVDEYLKHTARAMGLQEHACRREFQQYVRRSRERRLSPAVAEAPRAEPVDRDDCEFLAALLEDENLLERIQERLAQVHLPDSTLARVLARIFSGPVSVSEDFEHDSDRALYTAACAAEPPLPDRRESLVLKRLNRLVYEQLDTEVARIAEELRTAEHSKDFTLLIRLVAEKASLERQKEQVGAL